MKKSTSLDLSSGLVLICVFLISFGLSSMLFKVGGYLYLISGVIGIGTLIELFSIEANMMGFYEARSRLYPRGDK